MAIATLTTRQNGQRIWASWFNSIKTVIEELILQVGEYQKFTFAYSDFSAASTENDIEVLELPAQYVFKRAIIKHSQSFQDSGGGSISAFTVSLGITGALDKISLPFDVYQAAGNTVFKTVEYGMPENFGSATSIRINGKSTGANLDQADQGSLTVWVKTEKLP